MGNRLWCTLRLSLTFAPLSALAAQSADSLLTMRTNEAFNRIRRVTSSDVAMARTIADSLVRALPNDATVMPEALFARASIAPSAADAERDYSRVVNEYRFAPRVPDALMRLALLEGARSNQAGALRHLDRLLRDHSDSPMRSRASLMAGRLRLEANDPARGCELLAAAWASAGLTERDVKDQAESLGAKCPVSVAERGQRDPSPLGVMRAPRDSVPARGVLVTQSQRPVQRPVQRSAPRDTAPAPVAVRRDSPPAATVRTPAVPAATAAPVAPVPAPVPAPAPAPVRRAEPVIPPAPQRQAETAAASPPSAPAAAMRYAVQFAAYDDRLGAAQFAEQLQRGGIAARVEGNVKPFRVRAGRFATRTEAEATLQLWTRPGQPAIVVSYP